MSKVYVVQHEHSVGDSDDVKFIGVYSSRAQAEAAVERLTSQPGFAATPDGFHIDAYALDQDHWQEGFVTLAPVLVPLDDEGADAWRAVQAECLPSGLYRIASENPHPDDEHWRFPTGSIVRCEERAVEGEVQLVAVELAPHAG
jgi:hypothetical protein